MIAAFKAVFMRVWSSRKTWQVTIGGCAALAVKVLGLVAIVYHWTPQQEDLYIQQATTMIGAFAALAGAFVAFLTTVEDAARKFGITDPMPHEPTTTTVAATGRSTIVEQKSTQSAQPPAVD